MSHQCPNCVEPKKAKREFLNLDDLAPREARILIAKDVLANLDKLNVATNSYIGKIDDDDDDVNYDDDDVDYDDDDPVVELPRRLSVNADVAKIVPVLRKQCTVCALGSCMLSFIDLYDGVKIKDLTDAEGELEVRTLDLDSTGKLKETVYSKLSELFTPEQLAMIETAFECETVWNPAASLPQDVTNACIRFGRRHSNPKNRLRAIMNNILKNPNRGFFDPKKGKPKD